MTRSAEFPDEIAITWHVDDVHEVRPDLSLAQCRAVLCAARDDHDASLGINWMVLETIAEQLFPRAPGDY